MRTHLTNRERRALATLHGHVDSPQAGNVRAMRDGVYCNRLLGAAERLLFETMVRAYRTDYGVETEVAEVATLYLLQLRRAQNLDRWEAAEDRQRRWLGMRRWMRNHKHHLEAEKRQMSSVPSLSPCEWATALLERVAAGQAAEDGRSV